MATFLLGVIAVDLLGDKTPLSQQYFWAFLGSAFLIAVISFFDDMTGQGFLVKLATQILAALFVVASGIVLDQFSMPFVGGKGVRALFINSIKRGLTPFSFFFVIPAKAGIQKKALPLF